MSTCPAASAEQSSDDKAPLLLTENALDAAEACYLDAFLQVREEARNLLGGSADSVLAELVDDLAAVAVAAIEAMTELRRVRSSTSSGAPHATATTGGRHLMELADRSRSALAAHLALQIQARAEQC